MLHECKVHMNMKSREWGVETSKSAVDSNGAQTCTGLQSKPSPTAPYSAVNANLQKFAGIFRHGADVALKQRVQEHEAKRMEN